MMKESKEWFDNGLRKRERRYLNTLTEMEQQLRFCRVELKQQKLRNRFLKRKQYIMYWRLKLYCQYDLENFLNKNEDRTPAPPRMPDRPTTDILPPRTTGPRTTGPMTTGPMTTRPMTTRPMTNRPETTGPMTSGPATPVPTTPPPITTPGL